MEINSNPPSNTAPIKPSNKAGQASAARTEKQAGSLEAVSSSGAEQAKKKKGTAQLSTSALNKLTSAQLNKLDSAQLNKLNASQLNKLNNSQLAKLNPSQLSKVSSSKLQSLPESILAKLPQSMKDKLGVDKAQGEKVTISEEAAALSRKESSQGTASVKT